MQEVFCQVSAIDQLGNDVYRVKLTTADSQSIPYQGGQYLTLQASGGRWIPFSIGNAPEEKSHIELHIRLIPGHQLAEDILQQLKTTKKAHIQIPMGHCVLRAGTRKVVCIVGGTGFSPIKAMLESAFAQNDKRAFELYWGAQTASDFYLYDLPKAWQSKHSGFKFIPVVSGSDSNWQGETGFPHAVAINNIKQISDCDFYISGSEGMVMAVYSDLLQQGVPKKQIFSDMLDIKREMGEDI